MGKYVAIRMIILKRGEDPVGFQTWMTKPCGFLDTMWNTFKGHDLKAITFLKGYDQDRPSPGRNRKNSKAAGANVNFAWITYWTDKQTNEDAWRSAPRTTVWLNLWKEFMAKCFPPPGRPAKGPPYDYRAFKKGAGSLVAGFEEIWSKDS